MILTIIAVIVSVLNLNEFSFQQSKYEVFSEVEKVNEVENVENYEVIDEVQEVKLESEEEKNVVYLVEKENEVNESHIESQEENKGDEEPSYEIQLAQIETKQNEDSNNLQINQKENVVQKISNVNSISDCQNNTHFISVGNSGMWFNTKEEAIENYKQKLKYYSDKWEKFEITNEEYNKNCPYGYEVYSCLYCGKWTINFYYK